MADEQELLGRLGSIAREWRGQGPSGGEQGEIASAFQNTLALLYETGWDYALGWENELPDEYLPERYLSKRAEIIHMLENELAYRAMDYRGSSDGSEEQATILDRYRRTMEEMYRIGHWSGEPDAESFLPYELMPEVYKEYWRQRLRRVHQRTEEST